MPIEYYRILLSQYTSCPRKSAYRCVISTSNSLILLKNLASSYIARRFISASCSDEFGVRKPISPKNMILLFTFRHTMFRKMLMIIETNTFWFVFFWSPVNHILWAFSPARPLDFTPRVRREWKEKQDSLYFSQLFRPRARCVPGVDRPR